jgi:hypothetical protein
MNGKKYNPTLIEEGIAALVIPICVALSPLLRPWHSLLVGNSRQAGTGRIGSRCRSNFLR